MNKRTVNIRKNKKKDYSFPIALFIMLLLLFTVFLKSATKSFFTQTSASTISTEPELKVAFIGDTGITAVGNKFGQVLQLIKNENAQMVLHQGDFDYTFNPKAFFSEIADADLDKNGQTRETDGSLDLSFPYFTSVGNHDDSIWNETCTDADGCYATYQKQILQTLGITPDEPSLDDQKYSIDYKGLKMVFVGVNGKSSTFPAYINSQLSQDQHIWKVCSWHETQATMQLGTKSDDMGWGVYENCRLNGAIVATAHEHSYHRTRTLSNFQNLTVDSQQHPLVDGVPSNPNNLVVQPGKTFAFVSGHGGHSLRNQDRCTPYTYPYGGGAGCNYIWANVFTTDQNNGEENSGYGALFITFNYQGNPRRAHGYMKTVDGRIIDEFDILAPETTPTPEPIDTTFITQGSVWKYLDNNTRPTGWETTSFVDTSWKSGPAELGYGDGDEATVVSYGPSSSTKYMTTYFRNSFTVNEPERYTSLNLELIRDDGAVVYLNGTEVFRSNMPTGTIAHSTKASGSSSDTTLYTASVSPLLLNQGTNVVAIEVHQSSASSSDLSMDFSLKGIGAATGTTVTPTSIVATPTTFVPSPTTVVPTVTPVATLVPTAVPTTAPTNTPVPTGTSQQTVSLLPVADSWVNASSTSRNYGTATKLTVDGSPINIAYLRFNLAVLAGKNVTSAKLKLRISGSSSSVQNVKQVANTTWSETGLTYANRPSLGSIINTISNSKSSTYKEIDITSYVNTSAGSLMSIGMDATGGDGLDFYSKEYSNASYRPTLVVTYN